jgi:peroxiredoxin
MTSKRLLITPGETLGNATLVTSTTADEMRRVTNRLVGAPIPPAVLCANGEYPLNLHQLSCGYPLVIYVYPGSEASPESGDDTALMDAAQHRTFRDHQSDLEARGYRTIGVSSQAAHAQKRAMLEGRLTHELLSDPRLQLAERLQLPTFTDEGVWRYRRLTLIVHDGHIVKVFFPVSSAGRSAAQAIAWMTIQGIS